MQQDNNLLLLILVRVLKELILLQQQQRPKQKVLQVSTFVFDIAILLFASKNKIFAAGDALDGLAGLQLLFFVLLTFLQAYMQ